MVDHSKINIAIIGLGYVGMPLAAEFSKKYTVIGFDIDEKRISELKQGDDTTGELAASDFLQNKNLSFTSSIDETKNANVFIITVPTPVDDNNNPEFAFLEAASELVGKVLEKNDIVIYESTVFPGATEEICVPILEKISSLRCAFYDEIDSTDVFYVGYSPERVNPGASAHKLSEIVKLTSGSTPKIADFIDQLYKSIITAGTYKTSSIKIAEAAKVIENTQRDVNIALINEFAILFNKLNLDTKEILLAAETKWNFLSFRPGLVGGHCIGVDPYYLTYKAKEIGYTPEMILAGRRINDDMSQYASERIISLMSSAGIHVIGSNILILGFTFKENCPDIRNSKVLDLVNHLLACNANVDVFDPQVTQKREAIHTDGCIITAPQKNTYDCIVLAVNHSEFIAMGADRIREFGKAKHVFFDLKYGFDVSQSDGRL